MNEHAVAGCRRIGQGLFVKELDRALKRRGLTLSAFEHDLVAELHGNQQKVMTTVAPRTLGVQMKSTPLVRAERTGDLSGGPETVEGRTLGHQAGDRGEDHMA